MHCKAAVTVSLECVSFNGRPSSGTLKHWLMHFSPGVITMYRWPIFALLVLISFDLCVLRKQKKPPQTLSRGWGDDITWVQTYEEGLAKMQDSHKPLMVIHHTEECQHSQALKKAFAEHKDIQTMAQNDFIMLNVMHETIDQNLSPDGHYVPRILFVDPSFTVRADIAGKYSNHLYTYQPEDIDLLAENMRKAKTLVHPHPDL